FLACVSDTERGRLLDFLAGQTGGASSDMSADPAALLQELLLTRRADEWEQELLARGIPCVRADAVEGPGGWEHLGADGLVVEFEHELYGRMTRRGSLVQIDGRHPPISGREPLLGEHTRTLLGAAGYDGSQIDAWVGAGVVA